MRKLPHSVYRWSPWRQEAALNCNPEVKCMALKYTDTQQWQFYQKPKMSNTDLCAREVICHSSVTKWIPRNHLVETSGGNWCAGKELKKLTVIWSFHRLIVPLLSVWKYMDLLGFTASSSSSCSSSLYHTQTHTFTIVPRQSPNQRVKCTQGIFSEVIVLNSQKGGGERQQQWSCCFKRAGGIS